MDRVIYCFWTGDNPITERRHQSVSSIAAITGCRVEFITPATLSKWILPTAPLHPAYPYLSAVHRADYLRAYFMHHYGGGYTDIKPATGSWLPAFDQMDVDPECWAIGYAEAAPGDVARVPDIRIYRQMRAAYKRIIGNCSYICKKNTPLTEDWLAEVRRLLDKHMETLRAHPAPHPRARFPVDAPYPIGWTEICGNVFHPLVFRYLDHTKTGLPKPNCYTYQ